jgi:hypothetical protein
MTARSVPRRHWRSYGDDPLPTGREALDEPFSAFPSWYLRITCDRCGKDRMMNEVHTAQRDLPIREIIAKARHDGCGGRGRQGRADDRYRRKQPPGAADCRARRLSAAQGRVGGGDLGRLRRVVCFISRASASYFAARSSSAIRVSSSVTRAAMPR